MKSKTLKIQLRQMDYSDHSLVLSSWLQGGYTHCSAFRDMPKSLYYGLHEPTVKRVLSVSDGLCAVDPEDLSHVLGYVVYKHYQDFTVLHWIYVKQSFRHLGIGDYLLKALQPQELVFTSHETYESPKWLNRKQVKTYHVPHFRHLEWHASELDQYFKIRRINRET